VQQNLSDQESKNQHLCHNMSYQSFTSPLPSPPAEGHSLPFLPSKRLNLLRQAGVSRFTPPRRQSAWVMSGADSDGDSETSEEGRRSTDERVMSIPTIVLSEFANPDCSAFQI
jgi:hypothetical protein